jgi:hypothetical protein
VLVGNFLLWGESVPRLFANKKRPSLTNFSEIWGLSRLEPTDPPTGQCALPGPGVWHRTFTTANWSMRTSWTRRLAPNLHYRQLVPCLSANHPSNLRCHQLVTAHFLDPAFGTEPCLSPTGQRALPGPYVAIEPSLPISVRQLVNAPFLAPTFGTEPSLPPTGQCALSESFPGTEPSLPPTGQCALSESYVWHRTLPVTNSSHVCQLVNARPYWIIL